VDWILGCYRVLSVSATVAEWNSGPRARKRKCEVKVRIGAVRCRICTVCMFTADVARSDIHHYIRGTRAFRLTDTWTLSEIDVHMMVHRAGLQSPDDTSQTRPYMICIQKEVIYINIYPTIC
jgi:hypothetical protein